MSSEKVISMHWFRKGLRLHDNPALMAACNSAQKVYPIFVMDPYYAKPDMIGINRYAFVLESLSDLDNSLRALGSRLYVFRGKPEEQIPLYIEKWGVNYFTFEKDTDAYSRIRDKQIIDLVTDMGIKCETFTGHTMLPYETYIEALKGKPAPSTNGGFVKLFQSLRSKLREPLKPIDRSILPPLTAEELALPNSDVPTLEEMGYHGTPRSKFAGGETEALRRLQATVIQRELWTINFAKPNTSPNSIEPSTTVLSPYLKQGCLSATLFYVTLEKIFKKHTKYTLPPVSLHGQLLWREFFYFSSIHIPNFNKMEGNPQCRQIPWDKNPAYLEAWKMGRTGYPYIDAIMTQLREEGWIHHLARHSVACFLTRGDLWQSWEDGAKVFELYLLDADWALNNANWQWLSCSNFFYQYFRCYSPVAFGKKTDKNGDYIRKYIPQLKDYPTQYIYEPWKASLAVQKQCKCIIGVDYPHPIVNHDIVSKENMNKMKLAYAASGMKEEGGGGSDDDDDEGGNEEKKEVKPKKGSVSRDTISAFPIVNSRNSSSNSYSNTNVIATSSTMVVAASSSSASNAETSKKRKSPTKVTKTVNKSADGVQPIDTIFSKKKKTENK